MKKAKRIYITGSVHSLFFKQFVKQHADEHNVRGFLRMREDSKVEVFLEGENEDVEAVVAICKRGPQHANIRNVEETDEKLQDFKEFKILTF